VKQTVEREEFWEFLVGQVEGLVKLVIGAS
jgi:hypothetical protein